MNMVWPSIYYILYLDKTLNINDSFILSAFKSFDLCFLQNRMSLSKYSKLIHKELMFINISWHICPLVMPQTFMQRLFEQQFKQFIHIFLLKRKVKWKGNRNIEISQASIDEAERGHIYVRILTL